MNKKKILCNNTVQTNKSHSASIGGGKNRVLGSNLRLGND